MNLTSFRDVSNPRDRSTRVLILARCQRDDLRSNVVCRGQNEDLTESIDPIDNWAYSKVSFEDKGRRTLLDSGGLTLVMTPVAEANVTVAESAYVDKQRKEEADCERDDFEPSHVVLYLAIDNYA